MKYLITRYSNFVKNNPFNFIKNNIFDFKNLFRNIPKKNDSLVIYGKANSLENKKIPFNEQWECKDFLIKKNKNKD
mgnify:CR=1 FL=1